MSKITVEVIMIVLVILTLLFLASNIVCYSAPEAMPLAYSDEVKMQGNVITIVGHSTEALRKASYDLYVERNEKYRKQVEAEIKRKHRLEVEVAKFNNAILLQNAGAPRIYVSSWSSNYNQSQNQAINGSHNKTKQENERI